MSQSRKIYKYIRWVEGWFFLALTNYLTLTILSCNTIFTNVQAKLSTRARYPDWDCGFALLHLPSTIERSYRKAYKIRYARQCFYSRIFHCHITDVSVT
jgi:hypothetical protein